MGVRRAVQEAERLAEAGIPAVTFGELIHNPQVVEELKQQGIDCIHQPEEAHGRPVLIRSHGVSPAVYRSLEAVSRQVHDLTCPYVSKLHKIVQGGTADGTSVILVGEESHPEVQGTAGWAQGQVYHIASEADAETLPPLDKALVVVQTTFPPKRWEAILQVLNQRIPHLAVHNTICSATVVRQTEAQELAARADAMVVVGGRHSANTQKLYATCAAICPRTILVERAEEIPPGFANIYSEFIGIAAGASTPERLLKEVVTRMNDMEKQDLVPTPNEETKKDFMAEVDASLVKIRPGQTVTGTVVQISDEEVCVNIGYKSDGIIKRADLTEENVQMGQEIEVEVIKVNDGDGNVVLSQRSVASRKAWEALVAKCEEGSYVDGVGKDAVKGGLVVDVEGVRAFVPASQLDTRYVEKIDEYVGKELRLKIIDVDRQKRRLVCSRKAVILEENAARKQEIWEKLEEGMVIHGIVRRLTDFGAFVDLGGVDGLIHVTDLSWRRVKHPSEVVQPNQEVDVQILSLDRERERIALGYKQTQPHPWDNAELRYPEGCIVEGKVVRLADFGAFVELEPGLDGLVHISQVATTRVTKVDQAVNVGDVVRVKVLHVDTEKKRISLSIRQVLEDEAFQYGEAGGEYAEEVVVEEPVAEEVTEASEVAVEEPAAEAPAEEAVVETVEATEPEAAPEA